MSLSKIDLLNRSFRRQWRGYARAEVDALLQEAAERLGALQEENVELRARMQALEESLAGHKESEATLKNTLMTTQKMIEDIKAQAQKEAQLILDAASAKAEHMLNQSHQRLAQLHDDITELKRQRTQFEVKLRSLIQSHMRMMDVDKEDLEELEAAEAKLKYMKKPGAA